MIGDPCPLFCYSKTPHNQTMISKERILEAVSQKISNDDNFIVELTISADNDIRLVVDGDNGIPISYCEELDALIETALDRDVEDYSLEVSSAGIGTELKVTRQFRKNIGNKVEVTMPNGSWIRGTLIDADDEGFDVETEEKRKVEGQKKKQTFTTVTHFLRADVKMVKDIVEF